MALLDVESAGAIAVRAEAVLQHSQMSIRRLVDVVAHAGLHRFVGGDVCETPGGPGGSGSDESLDCAVPLSPVVRAEALAAPVADRLRHATCQSVNACLDDI